MNRILKSLGILAISIALGLSGAAIGWAQENFEEDALSNIQERLEESEEQVNPTTGTREEVDYTLIDYSARPWGNLPANAVELLEEAGDDRDFSNLEELNEFFLENPDLNQRLTIEEWLSAGEFDDVERTNLATQVINEMRRQGESQVNAILFALIRTLRNVMGAIAILLMVVAGIRLIAAQGEETVITEQKKYLIYAGVGLMMILLIEQLVYAILGTPGTVVDISQRSSTQAFSDEILGVVAYLKSLLAVVSVTMIIVSAVRMIGAMGEEEKIKNQRKMVVWILVGMIIVIINQTIIENIFIIPVTDDPTEPAIGSENVNAVIATLSNVAKFAMGFTGLIALVMLIYGAALFIANYTNDEQVEKAKKIIKYALLGIVVILSAFAIISTLIDFA